MNLTCNHSKASFLMVDYLALHYSFVMTWFQSDVFREPGDLLETHILILHSATASLWKYLRSCCFKHYFFSVWIHVLGSDSSVSS